MAHVIFTGAQPARDIKLGEGRWVHAERGKPVKVPERIAEALCEQRDWNRAPDEPKRTAKQRTPKSSAPAWGLEPNDDTFRRPHAEMKED